MHARFDFAAKLSQVEPGMSLQEVASRLGAPDQARQLVDNDGGHELHSVLVADEIWDYGIVQGGTFPTLGQVAISSISGVVETSGKEPPETIIEEISENRLSNLLVLIDQSSPIYGEIFNPLLTIRLVNALQRIGKDHAIAVIREYFRVAGRGKSSIADNLSLVLLVLFDVPETPGAVPIPCLGKLSPSPPQPRHLLPKYPVLLCDDVPWSVILGRTFAGHHSISEELREYQELGKIRATSLRPPDAPHLILDNIERSPLWEPHRWLDPERDVLLVKRLILLQMRRLLQPVDGSISDALNYDNVTIAFTWQKLREQLKTKHVRWDAQQEAYTATV